jgi:hypothetical protein
VAAGGGAGEGCLDVCGELVGSIGALSDVGVGAVDGRDIRPTESNTLIHHLLLRD